ncbi:MAG: hypothetical protein ACYDHG_11400 [Desulfomonilaceae bacterium]
MALPESLSWVFEGKEAQEFLEKMRLKRDKRALITGSRHSMDEVHKKVVENARKRKSEENGRKREK